MARTRFENRKAQLEEMLRRGDIDGIVEIFRGGPHWILDGRVGPVGIACSQMIEEILRREYGEP